MVFERESCPEVFPYDVREPGTGRRGSRVDRGKGGHRSSNGSLRRSDTATHRSSGLTPNPYDRSVPHLLVLRKSLVEGRPTGVRPTSSTPKSPSIHSPSSTSSPPLPSRTRARPPYVGSKETDGGTDREIHSDDPVSGHEAL